MKSFLYTRALSSIVFCCTVASICACDKEETAPPPVAPPLPALAADTAEDRADLEEQLAASNQTAATCQERVNELELELAEMKRLTVVSDEHALFEVAKGSLAQEDLSSAKVALENFLSHYPKSDMAKEARALLRTTEKELAAIEMRRHQEELMRSLSSLSVDEIIASPKEYARKSFQRTMCCDSVALSDYGSPTAIAELHWARQKLYNTRCYWNFDSDLSPELDSRVEVRLTQEMAKRFATEATKRDHPFCKYMVDGVLYFKGQVSYSDPVMYLREAAFR